MRHERIEREFPLMKISIPKATPDELQRGLDAAIAVFRRADVDPQDAADGVSIREGWDIAGFSEQFDISDQEMEAAAIWDAADTAAVDAACAGWDETGRQRPESAHLQLITSPATQLVDRDTALAMLRSRVRDAADQREFLDSAVADLAWVVAADFEDRWRARELVNALTVAFTALELSGFSPGEPTEPKRQGVLTAIDALERATN
ncbi:hypothetical protein P3C33_27910 [Mesorhizobium sp. P16.1]|uniref:hypothetical protein n=1 Tax=unclassified Mesorhizobium TaxID=325217 RepID=UPI0021A50451|nr:MULTISPECIES: hypothetical protein [unclassified Mesorhizobium]MCT2580963.1 hypothetical protein [Mesorhizobium sp. P13.3]MDF3169978.1 hypothetical protein [Mesorhizobium sp. P16.1]MDF3181198.1 hypothetical protein [Mesorhizobium sp. P17.1]MDF3186857.1 hypothetical protein [Mesorhizobium sp. ICCV3110.1]